MIIEFFKRCLIGVGRGSFFYLIIAGTAFILFYIVLKKPFWFRKIQQKIPMNTANIGFASGGVTCFY
jgi:hypothetical protein